MTYPRRNAATQRFTLGAPRTFVISRDGERVLFAQSRSGDDPVNCLWAIDLPETEPRLLVDPVALMAGGDVELTAEEKARRERAREAGGGIVTYTTHSDHGVIAFVLGGRLFLCRAETGETTELPTAEGAYDPHFSPDASQIAYHAGGSLRVTAVDGSGDALIAGPNDGEDHVVWGAAEFVAAEEMGRSRGFWWGPDNETLLVARVDTSGVERWHISEPVDASIEPRSLPYPAAGTTNATVDLFLVTADGETRTPVDWRRDEFEYIARAEWNATTGLHLTVQTRDQRTLAVLAVDPATAEVTERLRLTDPGWVELIGSTPRFFADSIVTVRDDHETDTRRLYVDDEPKTPTGLQVRSVFRVSKRGAVIGATDDATQVQIYDIDFESDTVSTRTDAPGVHRAMCGGDTVVIASSTMEDTRTTFVVHPAGGAEPFEIENRAERPDLDHQVSFHVVGSRDLNAALILPTDHDGSALPILMDPYGGPHAQRVLRSRATFNASQWFADQGFAVIVCDGRGTPGRGPDFEQAVLHDLAGPVLDDQVAALEALAADHPAVLDTDHVGIRGWSFGGYLAALAVLQRPDVFHAGVAGAPVTDWRLYDTHYTERYLGNPAIDDGPYEATDLTPLAPALERPLMLIHGLADDNVVAAHTFQLSRALLEAGRPHQVLPLSGVSHMTPQESVAENLLKLQVAFLKTSLGLDA